MPSESSALVPELSPGPRVRPECEEQEDEDEEVRPRGSGHLDGCLGVSGSLSHLLIPFH